MSDTSNKVQFNLKNVHYAINTGTDTNPQFAVPKHVPGAVTLTLDPEGSVEPFYADGIIYYQAIANNGYSGDLEIALFPDEMLVEIWGFEEDKNGVLIENADVEPKNFALLYQIDGDKNNDYYLLYKCSGTRPGVGSQTNEDKKTPQTRKSTISAVPLSNGKVMARTTVNTAKEVKDSWFNTVYSSESVEAATSESVEAATSESEV